MITLALKATLLVAAAWTRSKPARQMASSSGPPPLSFITLYSLFVIVADDPPRIRPTTCAV